MIHLDMPASLSAHLKCWILNMNPTGSESDAEDLKRYLTDLVDENTLSRPVIERKLREHLSKYNIYFQRDCIKICDSGVTLVVTGTSRCGHITLDSDQFDSSDELSQLSGYAEEIENSVWDDDQCEELINKWFELER